MSTVVNNPAPSGDNSSGMGFLFGIIILVILLAVIFIYGLPMLRRAQTGTQINVPDKIDVNVQQGGQGGNAPAGGQPAPQQ